MDGGLDLTVGPLGLGFWALFSSEVSLTGNDGFSSSEKVYRNYVFCFTIDVFFYQSAQAFFQLSGFGLEITP